MCFQVTVRNSNEELNYSKFMPHMESLFVIMLHNMKTRCKHGKTTGFKAIIYLQISNCTTQKLYIGIVRKMIVKPLINITAEIDNQTFDEKFGLMFGSRAAVVYLYLKKYVFVNIIVAWPIRTKSELWLYFKVYFVHFIVDARSNNIPHFCV